MQEEADGDFVHLERFGEGQGSANEATQVSSPMPIIRLIPKRHRVAPRRTFRLRMVATGTFLSHAPGCCGKFQTHG